MRKTDGNTTPGYFHNLRNTPMRILDMTKLTAMQMIGLAYNESSNAIDFCNWYTLNRPMLEQHERHLINGAYHDGINDVKQDPDHLLKTGEYFNDAFYIPKND